MRPAGIREANNRPINLAARSTESAHNDLRDLRDVGTNERETRRRPEGTEIATWDHGRHVFPLEAGIIGHHEEIEKPSRRLKRPHLMSRSFKTIW